MLAFPKIYCKILNMETAVCDSFLQDHWLHLNVMRDWVAFFTFLFSVAVAGWKSLHKLHARKLNSLWVLCLSSSDCKNSRDPHFLEKPYIAVCQQVTGDFADSQNKRYAKSCSTIFIFHEFRHCYWFTIFDHAT